jgi:hypothetical protein
VSVNLNTFQKGEQCTLKFVLACKITKWKGEKKRIKGKHYLFLMRISPVNCKFDRSTFVVISSYRPVVLNWHKTPGEEIVEYWLQE